MKKRFLSFVLTVIMAVSLVPSLSFPALATNGTFQTISAGLTSFAIKSDGSLWAWGSALLGNGTTESSAVPVKIMESVVSISSYRYNLAVKSDGTLWAWGHTRPLGCTEPHTPDGRRAGDGKVLFVMSPVHIMSNVKAVSAGDSYSLVLKNDGSLWCYGYEWYDVFPVKLMDDVAFMNAKSSDPFAVKKDGSCWTWSGVDYEGNPVSEATKKMDDVAAVGCGRYDMVVTKSGELWLLGASSTGSMFMDNVIEVDGVSALNCTRGFAITRDGGLWAWGDDDYGCLGDGVEPGATFDENGNEIIDDPKYLTTPVQIMEDTVAISAARDCTLGLKSDGSLWSWGWYISESHPAGTTTYRSAPVKIMDGVMLPGSAVITLTPEAPVDSASEWAWDGIKSALEKAFVPLSVRNNYKDVITRAEFCRMAVKWLEYTVGKNIYAIMDERGVHFESDIFFDTNDSDILAAYALGITNGTVAPSDDKPGQFSPNDGFTREQAATMIRNTCKAAGMDVSNIAGAGFTDTNTASSWAVDSINFCRNNSIMTGTSTTPHLFSPKQPYTREQSIVTFDRIAFLPEE